MMFMIGFWCWMNEECLYSDSDKLALFNTYLDRASDPHEKRLRLVETKKIISNGKRGKVALTTLKFADEKFYLNTFSKTFKLLITQEAGINGQDNDWIDAGLYLDIDYGVRTDHEIIFSLRKVRRNDAHWNVLSRLYDDPVHCVRKKIAKPSPDAV